MSNALELRGVHVPLITPFAADGSVALNAVESLAHHYLEQGATGIVALGTTGEATALDADEQRAVIDVCSTVCAERDAPLMVGIGTNNTRTTIAKAESLAGNPTVTSVLVVTPYYVRPSEGGIAAHMRAVADASPVPVVLYNIPYRTGRLVTAPTILELAQHPNIAGIKQSVGGIDADTAELLAGKPDGFSVLCGEDPFMLPMIALGGSGTIAAAAHVLTARFVALVDAALDGRFAESRVHHEALLPVVQACFTEPNPAVFKGVLHAQGLIPTPDLRLPMTNASEGAVARALAAIDAAS